MADSFKDILITPNRSNTADPKLEFRGGNTTVNTTITVTMYPDANGTLSFDGSVGQLFSITNDLSGVLWSVNDISGMPSLEVLSSGVVKIAEYGGNVGIGTANPIYKLDVAGEARIFNDIGSTYGGSFRLYNSATGATNPAKNFRISPTGSLEFINSAYSGIIATLLDDGNFYASTSFQAPIFYDSNNTGYYIDPNGTSILNNVGAYGILDVTGQTYIRNSVNILNTAGTGWNTLINRNGGDSWIVYGGDSVRAPIFYDSNNTAFYTNPAGTSVLFDLTINGGGVNLGNNATIFEYSTDGNIGFGLGAGYTKLVRLNANGDIIAAHGSIYSYTAMSAPIFYDTNNTAYYVNPNGTSNLLGLTVTNTISGSINGNAGTVTNGVYTTDNVVTARPTIIYSDSADFNTFTTAGTYQVLGSTWSGSSNAPTNGYTYGQLVVTTNGSIVTQNYYTHATTGHFVRSKYNASDWTVWQEMVLSSNFNDFAPSASGTWSINVTGSAGSVPFNNLTSKTSGTGTYTTSGDFRAPIFYDSDDTISRWNGSELILRGASPTVFFRDTDHNSAMLHVNSNVFYILRGGNDTETWTTVNGVWPFQIDLTSNWATFGGGVTSGVEFRAPIFYDSDNTAYYINPNGISLVNSLVVNSTLDVYGIHYLRSNLLILNTAGTDWKAVINRNGGDNWIVYGGDSVRAPVFYDSDNTAYYLDAANSGTALILNGIIQGRSSAATDVNTANDTGSLSVRANTSTVAAISFHRTGAYAMNMGLGTDNVFRIGGWSASNNCFQMTGTGDLTMLGNITAYSDERLKTDIAKIENAVEKVQAINGYSYTRTDTGSKHIGVIAQEVMKVIPEVVMGSDDTHYSVAYGNMVGLLIEAIKEQQDHINRLETKINSLQGK